MLDLSESRHEYTTGQITPVVSRGEFLIKRDDLWDECGIAYGGKARTAGLVCRHAAAQGYRGLVIAISRNSSVPGMLSRVAAYDGLELHVHTASGELSATFQEAVKHGAHIYQHKAGYLSVLNARKRAQAMKDPGLMQVGLGVYCSSCPIVEATAAQVVNLPADVNRVVMVVGSGWMFRGVMYGLSLRKNPPQLLGVCVGTPPQIQLPEWASLRQSPLDFLHSVDQNLGGIPLDPTYEGKCVNFLKLGDLFWIVCHRDTE